MDSRITPAATLLVALWCVALLPPLIGRDLWDPDETRYGEIAREMAESGDWGTPRLFGIAYPDKPPLAYWMTCLSLKTFGVNAPAVRLPAFLAGLAIVLAMHRWGGLRAGGVMATSFLLIGISQAPLLDGPLAAFVTLAIYFARARLEGGGIANALLFWIFTALAVDTKGPVGLAPLIIVPGALVLSGRGKEMLRLAPLWGIVLMAVLVIPVYALMEHRMPGFLRNFLINQNLKGALSPDSEVHHQQGFWYAPRSVLGGFLPWTLLLPAAIAWAWSQRSRWRSLEATLPIVWFTLFFGVFALSRSKLATYYLPALPPLALLVGRWWEAGAPMKRGWAAVWGAAAPAVPVGAVTALSMERILPALAREPQIAWRLLVFSLAVSFALLLIARSFWKGRSQAALASVALVVTVASAASPFLIGPLAAFRTVSRFLPETLREPVVIYRADAAGVAFHRKKIPRICGLTRDYTPLRREPEKLWPEDRLHEAGTIITYEQKLGELRDALHLQWKIVRLVPPHVILEPLPFRSR